MEGKPKYYKYGSVEDIRSSLRLSKLKSVFDCNVEIEMERSHQNRVTVIKMLEAQKNRLIKEKEVKDAAN